MAVWERGIHQMLAGSGVGIDRARPGSRRAAVYDAGLDSITLPRGRRRSSAASGGRRLHRRGGGPVSSLGGSAGAITLLHELAHASGHGSRLNRRAVTGKGRISAREYAREEVVAELTATRVAKRLGMPPSKRYNRRSGTRGYVREYVSEFGENRRPRTGRGGRGRTRAEAAAIVRDVRAAENYLMSLAGGPSASPRGPSTSNPGRLLHRRRAGRPVRGGGS